MRNVVAAFIVIAIAGVVWLSLAKRTEWEERPERNGTPRLSPAYKETMKNFSLTSMAFTEGGIIPSKYTCDGAGINPPLTVSGTLKEAKSLVLIMDDPDVPKDRRPDGLFVHWVRFNVPPDTKKIVEGEEPAGIAGAGTSADKVYHGPCPPDGEHRYFFKLYALDVVLPLPEGSNKEAVEKAMDGHILARTQLMGRYNRTR